MAGLPKLDYVMKEKILIFHPLKSVYMVYGSLKYKQEVKQELEENSLMLGDIILKKAKSHKYLRDILHEDGLKASVSATVKEREGRTRGSIYELSLHRLQDKITWRYGRCHQHIPKIKKGHT